MLRARIAECILGLCYRSPMPSDRQLLRYSVDPCFLGTLHLCWRCYACGPARPRVKAAFHWLTPAFPTTSLVLLRHEAHLMTIVTPTIVCSTAPADAKLTLRLGHVEPVNHVFIFNSSAGLFSGPVANSCVIAH